MTPDKYSMTSSATRSNSKRTDEYSVEELSSIPESSGEDYLSDTTTFIEDSSEDTKQI